jgi:GNAT superfamily N-acetyltransferase
MLTGEVPGGGVPAGGRPADQSALLDEVGRRWRAADQLLPAPTVLAPADGCGAMITLQTADGRLLAAGACEHWHGEADDMELSWGAARRFQLTVRAGGADLATTVTGLIGRWREHLAGVSGIGDPDSAAIVMWPSRDVDGVRALRRHGLAPHAVVAARAARRPADGGEADRPGRGAAGASIRRADASDLDITARLGLEVFRYDALFGSVVERPSTPAALRDYVAGLLAAPQPWIWLAERDGAAIGVLIAEPPTDAGWIAPLIGLAPVVYNALTYVVPAERGTGVSDALVASFHAAADTAGVPAALLHYDQANPLSVPFWSRHGYRPMWTSWEARPACAMH